MKHTIYVSGRVTKNTKRICIRLLKRRGSRYYITTFVTPNKKGKFSVKISTAKNSKKTPVIQNNRGRVAGAKDCYSTCPGYKAVPTIGAGTYHLVISKATTKKAAKISGNSNWQGGTLGGNTRKWFAYKEVLMTVKKGHSNDPKVIKYPAVINNNRTLHKKCDKNAYASRTNPGSTERYLDEYMKDMGYIFKDPKTGISSPMKKSQVNYIKRLAAKVTFGCNTDYKKMQAIYKYVATNVYYDWHAFVTHKYQYANPYLNLYHLNNKQSSGPNYRNGRVATTCQGYAAMVIAMARCLDIPARYAYGCHVTLTGKTWMDMKGSDVSKRNHWWAEAYVDGRWILIDGNPGSYNKWFRSSFVDPGFWSYGGLGNYSAFDPSDEQLSASYIYTKIYPGSKEGRFASDYSETKQLRAFLETVSNNVKNGSRLNASYKTNMRSTWGDGNNKNFSTDGYGHIKKIQWPGHKLSGLLNLDDYDQLEYVSIYNNRLNAIQLDQCSSLRYLAANNNRITEFDSSDSHRLSTIHLLNNKLTSAYFMHRTKKISIHTEPEDARVSFSMSYDKKASRPLCIKANAVRGYKYKGIYTSSGKKISSKESCSFIPSSGKYVVKYERIDASNIKLNRTEKTLAVGRSTTLKATLTGPEGFYDQGVTWESSDNNVATVTSKGVVKGIAAGQTTITATEKDGSQTATCLVTVTEPVVVDEEARTVTLKGIVNADAFTTPTMHYLVTANLAASKENPVITGLNDRINLAMALDSLGATAWNDNPGTVLDKDETIAAVKDYKGTDANYSKLNITISWEGHEAVALQDTLTNEDGTAYEGTIVYSNTAAVQKANPSGCEICTTSCSKAICSSENVPFGRLTLARTDKLPKAGTIVTITISIEENEKDRSDEASVPF